MVGGGSAGRVLATRLSQDPARSVLLVEAGPDYGSRPEHQPDDVAHAPAATHSHACSYASEPRVLNRSVQLHRGQLVGGSSAINSAVALRGHPADYDFASSKHGTHGPVPVRRQGPGELNALHRAFHAACTGQGHPNVADHNAPGAHGVGPAPVNRVASLRHSTALTYLAQARHRRNLTVRAGVFADRVLLGRHRAVGVQLADTDRTVVPARRVVLTAGAYSTPAILLRSGIGPAAQLRSLGIPVHADLPGVGANLQEHPAVTVTYPSNVPPGASHEPILQTYLTCAPDGDNTGQASSLQIFPSGPEHDEHTRAILTLWITLMRPYSRGQLWLSSGNPHEALHIDVGLLQAPEDSQRLKAGIRTARQLAATPPLSGLLGQEQAPGPQSLSLIPVVGMKRALC